MTASLPSLSVIVVNYFSETDLGRCLDSLSRFDPDLCYELIVVDNGSTGGELDDVLRPFVPSVEVKVIASDQNVGFARACNRGLGVARGEYILFLNPDVLFIENSVSRMIDFLDRNAGAGAVGCSQVLTSGRLHIGRAGYHPGLVTAFNHSFFLSRFLPGIFRGIYLIRDKTDDPLEVDWVSGGFLLARQEVVRQVGGFDESFFLYSEDMEWCFRIKKKGWNIYYLPYTRIVHERKESSSRAPNPGVWLKSQVSLYRRDHHVISVIIFAVTVISGLLLRSALYLILYLLWRRPRDKAQGKKLFRSVFEYFH